jgi:hypothetical protein
MFFKYCVRSCAAILLTAGAASAHGPQIQVTADQTGPATRKIVTRDIMFDPYMALAAPKQLYVMPAFERQGVWYTAPDSPANFSGPGLAYGTGHTFADNSVLSITFVDQLLRWDGSDFVDAGSTDLQGYQGGSLGSLGQLINPTATATASAGGSLAVSLGIYTDPNSHTTRRFRFLGGDATTTTVGTGLQTGTKPTMAPTDGIYLASFVLSSNEVGLDPSDPYYFLVYKGVAWSEVMAASRSLGISNNLIQGIPEPTSSGLVSFGLVVWLSRRSSVR